MGKLNDWYSSTVTANQGARPARTSHAQAIDRWDSRQVLQRVCGGCGVREGRTEKQSQRPTRKEFSMDPAVVGEGEVEEVEEVEAAGGAGRDVVGPSLVEHVRDIDET